MPLNTTQTKFIKLSRNVDLDGFQSALEKTKYGLAEMIEVNQIVNIFSRNLQNSINDYVPKKTIDICPTTEPVWLNKESHKLVTKQRRLYNRLRYSGGPYDQHKRTKARMKTEATIKKDQKKLY